jgi:hypothetical protein
MNMETDAISFDMTSLEGGDLLPNEVRGLQASEQLSEVEIALCDGEGGMAPSRGTKAT